MISRFEGWDGGQGSQFLEADGDRGIHRWLQMRIGYQPTVLSRNVSDDLKIGGVEWFTKMTGMIPIGQTCNYS